MVRQNLSVRRALFYTLNALTWHFYFPHQELKLITKNQPVTNSYTFPYAFSSLFMLSLAGESECLLLNVRIIDFFS